MPGALAEVINCSIIARDEGGKTAQGRFTKVHPELWVELNNLGKNLSASSLGDRQNQLQRELRINLPLQICLGMLGVSVSKYKAEIGSVSGMK